MYWKNDVQLLDCLHGMIEREVKETIYINMTLKSLAKNRDTGKELSHLIMRRARGSFIFRLFIAL